MISLNVNGKTHEVDSAPDTPLLWVLREKLKLTGTKYGCGIAQCGACTVHVDGEPTRACVTPVANAVGKRITTIEGLGDGSHLHPLQRAFLAHSAVQCGFCSPGMIMTALGLLNENPTPTEADIRNALSGSLCRCTGYRQIIDAVQEAAAVMRRGAEVAP